jgi:hypothetical protein
MIASRGTFKRFSALTDWNKVIQMGTKFKVSPDSSPKVTPNEQ